MNQKIESAAEFVWYRMMHPVKKKCKPKRQVKSCCRSRRGPDADELNRMYNGMGMSAPQIAKECDISQSYTRALLKKYGIKKIGYNGQ